MRKDIQKFLNVTDADNLKVVNHNDRDYNSFNDFQSNINERFEKLENDRSLRERKKNLRMWDKSLPERWSGARLSKIENPAAKKAMKIIRDNEFASVFVQGEAGSGKTYLSYAIARKFIEKGWVTPSEIKIISEENLMSIPKMGFSGQANLEKLFSAQYKLYIFDNAGSRDNYDSKEGPIWEQLIDHIYTNSLVAIFTSPSSARIFADKLTDTAESKFKHLVHRKVITMKKEDDYDDGLGDYSEQEKNKIKREEQKVKNFSAFK